jgi:hypothetical protein
MKEHLQAVHHFALSVIAVARRFYIDLLGAREISASEWQSGNPAAARPTSAAAPVITQFAFDICNHCSVSQFKYFACSP